MAAFYNAPFSKAFFVDFTTLQTAECCESWIEQEKVRQILEFKRCGLTLPDDRLDSLFEGIVGRRDILFEEFRAEQLLL